MQPRMSAFWFSFSDGQIRTFYAYDRETAEGYATEWGKSHGLTVA